MMTEHEYLMQNITLKDKLCGHSIWLPVFFIVALMTTAAYELPFVPVQRTLLMFFLFSFVVAVVCRTILNAKVARLKDEYQNKYR